MEVLSGQVLNGGLGTWAFMVKGHQHWIFLNNGPLASERALVFKFQLHPGPLVLWLRSGHRTVVLGASGGQNSLLCTCFSCMTCGLGQLSLKSNAAPTSSNRIGLFRAGSAFTVPYSSQVTSSLGPSDDVSIS